MTMEFTPFKKIPRLNREIIITEKIDGTNACIAITESGEMYVGSRSRWITPENDNFGFAAWAHEHKEELLKLGPGHHFGEWWGAGIQRKYGMTTKKFSLFNTTRWNGSDDLPKCCGVVPELYRGDFSTILINLALKDLRRTGSVAAPGFMEPEGIVVFHTAANCLFKVTLDKDDEPKGKNNGQ